MYLYTVLSLLLVVPAAGVGSQSTENEVASICAQLLPAFCCPIMLECDRMVAHCMAGVENLWSFRCSVLQLLSSLRTGQAD